MGNRRRNTTGDPLLLTPGPITTSTEVKQAMLHDLGSRDEAFIALTARVRRGLLELVRGNGTHECIPIQGSGTYAVEAMLATLLPRQARLLNLVNGAYGRRIGRICEYLGRSVTVSETTEDLPIDPKAVDRMLRDDPAVTHVSLVHCETTTGLLNPLREIAAVAAGHGKLLLLDAMSSFGALSIDVGETPLLGIAASANKCLEGVPGIAFCIVRRGALAGAAGNAHSLSLDLHEQWRVLEETGQWRFTPPTHCLMALEQALAELAGEGGPPGRCRRYAENRDVLVRGMREVGFETLLDDAHQAPVIVTFRFPLDPAFRFQAFYDGLRQRGFIIYPGKLTSSDTFRIGCIGRLFPDDMHALLKAVRATAAAMGMKPPRMLR